MTAVRGRGQFAQRWASWTEKVRYRITQFFDGWRAAVTAQDLALVEQVLSPVGPAADKLFQRMPVDARGTQPAALVKALRADGPTQPELAAAALLHDVGKVAADDAGAYLGLWIRGPIVLLEAWHPDLLAGLASSQPAASLRYALFVHLEHSTDRCSMGQRGRLQPPHLLADCPPSRYECGSRHFRCSDGT